MDAYADDGGLELSPTLETTGLYPDEDNAYVTESFALWWDKSE